MFKVPSRLRTDKGGENVGLCGDTWRRLEEKEDLHTFSVHNCRIERLWRDVRSNVLATFSTIFLSLENTGVLDPENETDLFCLHYILIPRINKSLRGFQQAWNSHCLSTECNWSPLQLFTACSLVAHCSMMKSVQIHNCTYGIDDEEASEEDDSQGVNVPTTYNPLSDDELQSVQAAIETLQESSCYGGIPNLNIRCRISLPQASQLAGEEVGVGLMSNMADVGCRHRYQTSYIDIGRRK